VTAGREGADGALSAALNSQRAHVLGILEGLAEADLRRPVLPSGWSCLGLVHHLAVDVEQFWLRAVAAGQQDVIDQLTEGNAWQVPSELSAAAVLDLYRQQISAGDDVLATTPWDAPPAWWPAELFGDWRLGTVRQIVLHMVTEIACHAGHLDAARELIDGRQWLVLTE